MYRALLALLAIAILPTSPAAAAKRLPPSAALEPSGPWKLDYGARGCTLEGSFGIGEHAVIVSFSRGSAPDAVDIAIGGRTVPRSRRPVEASLRSVGQAATLSHPAYSMAIGGRPERFVRMYDVDLGVVQTIAAGQDLAVAIGDDFTASLKLRAPERALASLAECYDNLLTSWQVDPKQTTGLAQRPRRIGTLRQTNPGLVTAYLVGARQDWDEAAWVTPMDYPTAALREERSGVVVAALSLNPSGGVVRCTVVAGSGFAPLDQRTCEVLSQRAHYTPGRDAAGAAVESTTLERIIWRVPVE